MPQVSAYHINDNMSSDAGHMARKRVIGFRDRTVLSTWDKTRRGDCASFIFLILEIMWEFPRISGACVGVLIIRVIVITLGYMYGLLILGKLPHEPLNPEP